MITDPVRACESMLGQTIQGISIDDIDGEVIITCNKGLIIFDLFAVEVNIQVEESQ